MFYPDLRGWSIYRVIIKASICSIKIQPMARLYLCPRLICAASLLIILLNSCAKTSDAPVAAPASAPAKPMLQVATQADVLLQDNDSLQALHLSWAKMSDTLFPNAVYTVEAANHGTSFAAPAIICSGPDVSATLSVREWNDKLRSIIVDDRRGLVDLRLKISSDRSVAYSDVITVAVTPYQPLIKYSGSSMLEVTGDNESTILPAGSRIVSVLNNGEYEGYVSFGTPVSKFFISTGQTVYMNGGSNSISTNGSPFTTYEGPGIYRVQVNMNTNNWATTKIGSWGLNGTAVTKDGSADAVMQYDDATQSWRITTTLQPGDFVFRADGSNTVFFGHNTGSKTGAIDYYGEKIHITAEASYTVVLRLMNAGNYGYSLQRNN